MKGHYFTTPLTDENSGTTPDAGWFFLTGVKRHCIEQDGVAFVVDSATIKIVLREQYRIDKIDRITSEEAKPILSYPQWLESRLIEREQERENYFATCEKYRSQLAEKEKYIESAKHKAIADRMEWLVEERELSEARKEVKRLTRQTDKSDIILVGELIGLAHQFGDVIAETDDKAKEIIGRLTRLRSEVERLTKELRHQMADNSTMELEVERIGGSRNAKYYHEDYVYDLKAENERLIKKADKFYVDWCSMRDTISPLTRQLSESQKELKAAKMGMDENGLALIELTRDLAEAYEAICILWETPDSALVRLPIEQLDELKAIVQKASAGK